MQSSEGIAVFVRGRQRNLHNRSTLVSKSRNPGSVRLGNLSLLFLFAVYPSFCHGLSSSDEGSFTSYTSKGSNCLHAHSVSAGDSCTSIRLSSNVTQAQLLLLNPDLNCKKLNAGQSLCVQGIPPNCKKKIRVFRGNNSAGGCEEIAAIAELTPPELLSINPGLICPDSENQSSVWSSSREVCVARGPGSVFIEYMGASGKSISFDDMQAVVNASKAVFHVALGFVIDYDRDGNYKNGTFSKFWNDDLTPASAKAFKKKNPGVRLLMSLGGDSLWVNDSLTVDVDWLDPPDPEAWIDNAQASLTGLAELYNIDGIDIDFEHFPADYSVSNSAFTFCIGTLIQKLKDNNTIGIATIAPFGSVMPQYQDLMANFGDLIDYISFQFYAYDLPTTADYVQTFRATTLFFDPAKLLASTQINGTRSITGTQFRNAVNLLQEEDGLLGVMLYDADASRSLNFAEEKGVLALIPGPYDGSLPAPTPPPPPLSQGNQEL
ncbi:hypothetical protein AXG93_492s1070 [Marchantia polymorpha subsp. ruderalis]|uniref:Uncharacterized protein n=1 Tax=Marchantia polymorpha subsp. ruderalis TaxID=1480154 RepID=A0A176W4Q1_MARPO|nr:hypothetical protein AXG93_492s1070 [Marchantia polymorpha subsp. ruderalis]